MSDQAKHREIRELDEAQLGAAVGGVGTGDTQLPETDVAGDDDPARSSSTLFQACVKGQHIPKAKLTV